MFRNELLGAVNDPVFAILRLRRGGLETSNVATGESNHESYRRRLSFKIEGTYASEIARQMNFFPAKISGTIRALSSSDPKLRTGGRPITCSVRQREIWGMAEEQQMIAPCRQACRRRSHEPLCGSSLE
jgi:hypothetical protein